MSSPLRKPLQLLAEQKPREAYFFSLVQHNSLPIITIFVCTLLLLGNTLQHHFCSALCVLLCNLFSGFAIVFDISNHFSDPFDSEQFVRWFDGFSYGTKVTFHFSAAALFRRKMEKCPYFVHSA